VTQLQKQNQLTTQRTCSYSPPLLYDMYIHILTALQAGRSRVLFPMASLDFFFIDTILPDALWPWEWLSL